MESSDMKIGSYWRLPAPSNVSLGEPEGQQGVDNYYFVRSSLCEELPQGELVGMGFAPERAISESSGVLSTLRLIIKVGDVVFHAPVQVQLRGVVPPTEQVADAQKDLNSLTEAELRLLQSTALLRDQVEATARALPLGELIWADFIDGEIHVVARAPGGGVVHAQRSLDGETPFKLGFQANPHE